LNRYQLSSIWGRGLHVLALPGLPRDEHQLPLRQDSIAYPLILIHSVPSASTPTRFASIHAVAHAGAGHPYHRKDS
jgi:hypothetical protein